MKCPFCGFLEDKVVDSRESKEADSIRRRRECLQCQKRFTTYERIDEIPYMVVKKDGRREKFDAVPFFWSQHYDVAINYVGHAENWEAIEIDGSLDARDCSVVYKKGGRTLAIVTISRDLRSLQAEAAMEAEIKSPKRDVA